MSDTMTIPASLGEKFNAWLDKLTKGEGQQVDPTQTDAYKALQTELGNHKTELDNMKAQQLKASRVEKYTAEVKETKATQDGAGDMLAGMTDEQAKWVITQLSALSAQIDEAALLGRKGRQTQNTGLDSNPVTAFDAAVNAKVIEKSVPYLAAYELVKAEKPDLFNAYVEAQSTKGKE